MITKYRLAFGAISKVEVVRETEKCVYLLRADSSERRQLKISPYESYFDTYEEAKQSLINSIRGKLNKAMIEANHHKRKLEAAEKMEEQ